MLRFGEGQKKELPASQKCTLSAHLPANVRNRVEVLTFCNTAVNVWLQNVPLAKMDTTLLIITNVAEWDMGFWCFPNRCTSMRTTFLPPQHHEEYLRSLLVHDPCT